MAKLTRFVLAGAVALSAPASAGAAESARPAPVSPGALDRTLAVSGPCPVLSWSSVPGGRDYELAIFAVEDRTTGADAPAVSARMHGAALSWTPPLEKCLSAGEYAWVVRAETAAGWSEWSAPRFFRIQESTESPEIRRLVERLVEEKLAARAPVPSTQPQIARASPRRPETRAVADQLTFTPAGCRAGEEVFADVPASSPYCAWIERLYRDGVTAGCGNGNFCPTSPVTRQQLAQLLEKAMQRRGLREIDSGDYHVCALTAAGRTACWGAERLGSTTPPGVVFTTISAGLDYACGVTETGSVLCWGENRSGRTTPPQTAYVSLSAGAFHVCGIEPGGEVSCWGESEGGRLDVPQNIYRSLSAGNSHTCGVTQEGTVACWGSNYFGQSSPPAGLFTEVTSGGGHTCGLRPDHTVACWGWNENGQSTTPPGTFKSISAGAVHTCGIKTDGLVACWGSTADGRSSPPWGNYADVTAGGLHTCALTVDGAVVCWGYGAGGATNAPPWL